jgi:hypothetical protein
MGRHVDTEKIVEILIVNGKPVRTVDPFGVGQMRRQ